MAEAAPIRDEHAGAPGPRREGELIAAGAGLALLVLMFALKWYGVIGLPHGADRSAISSATSAWQQLEGVRWVMLLTALVAIGAVILHVSQHSHGAQTDTGALVAGLGALTTLLLANRVLVDLPAASSVVDVKLGAFLGLLAAVGIVLGGAQAIRDERRWNASRRVESRLHAGLPSAAAPR